MHAATPERPAQKWNGLEWPGATVVIMASGQSLTAEQCAAVLGWRAMDPKGNGRKTIVINNTFLRAPWADVLYACDGAWWRVHAASVGIIFRGQRWTQDVEAQREFGVHRIESQRLPGLGKRPGVIHQGGNGGYQAINLAFQAGARRIILLGYDMHGTHWHGAHGNGLPNTQAWLYAQWVRNFDRLAADLEAEGVQVVNATPGSKLECFPRKALSVALS